MQGDGWNALHWASQNGHIDVVTILLERVADVNTRNVSDLLFRLLDNDPLCPHRVSLTIVQIKCRRMEKQHCT